MSEQEILDQVDKQGNVIGKATRAEFHSNPNIIHPVAFCWLFNSKGQVLWQQRSMQKVHAPGLWDMSCGGHILSVHTPEDTIQRELEEELGLEDLEIKYVEKYIRGNETQTELIYLYYAITDKHASEFKLQAEEVEKVEWIDLDIALKEVIEGNKDATEFIYTQVPRIFKKFLLRV